MSIILQPGLGTIPQVRMGAMRDWSKARELSRAEEMKVGVLVASNPVTLARSLIAAGVSYGFLNAYRAVVDTPVDNAQLMEDIASYLRYERAKWRRKSPQKKPFGFPIPTRKPSKQTLDDPSDHEFEDFWRWLERRRGQRRGGFHADLNRRTI